MQIKHGKSGSSGTKDGIVFADTNFIPPDFGFLGRLDARLASINTREQLVPKTDP